MDPAGTHLRSSLYSKLQVRADRIQSDIEELVKALNERCKSYGLRAKPITLTELPFGKFLVLRYLVLC